MLSSVKIGLLCDCCCSFGDDHENLQILERKQSCFDFIMVCWSRRSRASSDVIGFVSRSICDSDSLVES